MNEIVNTFLLAGDRFVSEMLLKQPGFTYSACGPFTKNKERIQKFKETGDTSYVHKTKYDGYQRGLASMVYRFFDKKSAGSGIVYNNNINNNNNNNNNNTNNNQIKPNSASFGQLAKELHKQIIRKFKKRDVYSVFRDNI